MKYRLKHALKGHAAAVYTLLYHKKTNGFFSGGSDGHVGLWDVEAGASQSLMINVGKPIFSLLQFDELLIIGQNEGGIHIVDVSAKKEVRHLLYHSKGVFDLLHIPKEQVVLSAGGDGKLILWDANDFKVLLSLEVSAMKLRCLHLSQDGNTVWTGSSDGFIRVFDSRYFNELWKLKAHEGGVYSLQPLHNGGWMSGGRDGHLRFWNMGTEGPEEDTSRAIPAHNFAIYGIAAHPSGTEWATASRDKTVKVWQADHMLQPQRLGFKQGGHSHSVNAVKYSPCGKWLISAGDDRQVLVWEPQGPGDPV